MRGRERIQLHALDQIGSYGHSESASISFFSIPCARLVQVGASQE